MEDFQNSVKGAAIKIKLETENVIIILNKQMYNDIETKIRGDLCG